jgi:hypothetical protein
MCYGFECARHGSHDAEESHSSCHQLRLLTLTSYGFFYLKLFTSWVCKLKGKQETFFLRWHSTPYHIRLFTPVVRRLDDLILVSIGLYVWLAGKTSHMGGTAVDIFICTHCYVHGDHASCLQLAASFNNAHSNGNAMRQYRAPAAY